MRSLFTILFLLCGLFAGATNYYVKNLVGDMGNDGATGTSDAQAWASLAKVNGFTFSAGDQIFFKRGGVWTGQLKATASGTSWASPITYGMYGTGADPEINGFTTLTGWANFSTNVYRVFVEHGGQRFNLLTLNGSNTAMGRLPKMSVGFGGYNTVNSHSGGSITSTTLTGNLTGAEIVIRKGHDVLDTRKILSHSGTTVTFSDPSNYWGAGNGYFIQNHISTLTQQGDWMYDQSSGYLYIYLTQAPTAYTIKVPTTDVLFDLNGKQFVHVDGINFIGANTIGVNADVNYQNGFRLTNSTVRYAGINALRLVNTNGSLIENDTLEDANNDGIYGYANVKNTVIRNNVINRIGMLPGMGQSEFGNLIGIGMQEFSKNAENGGNGSGNLVEYNKLTNIGQSPMSYFGGGWTIQYNYISDFNQVTDDGGAIYFGRRDLSNYTQYAKNIIRYNIIRNGAGNGFGISNGEKWADGIYPDDLNNLFEIMYNSVENCARYGIYIHTSFNIKIVGNTLFNSATQLGMEVNDGEFPGILVNQLYITQNTIINKQEAQDLVLYRSGHPDGRGSFGTTDSNRYLMPTVGATKFYTSRKESAGSGGGQGVPATDYRLSYSGWKGLNPAYEVHSSMASFSSSGTTAMYFNPTSTTSTQTLDGTYVDVAGTSYNGSIAIEPYRSTVLRRTGNVTGGTTQTLVAKNIAIMPGSGGYYESLPVDYASNPTKKYALLWYNHGGGEGGNGTTQLSNMLAQPLPGLINSGGFPSSFTVNGETFSFIVIMPQYSYWVGAGDVAIGLEYIKNNYRVDTNRIYMTGMSMGGGIAWDYAGSSAANANRIAALVPIAGNMAPVAGHVTIMANRKLPIWALHNSGDLTVGVANTNGWVDQFNAKTPTPSPLARKTIFNAQGHDAWTQSYDPTYKEEGKNIYEWMLQYSKGSSVVVTPPPSNNNGIPKSRRKYSVKVVSMP